MIKTDTQTIHTLINRGTAQVIVKKDLEKKLQSGKKLRIKLGIDPTGADLTLGHTVVLRKLRQFQQAGHQIVLLFGTFTARIGDPTGKSQTRTPLTKEQILKNAKTYIDQASQVLDMEKVEVVYNGDWLEKMSFEDVLKLAGNFTVAQMMERDMFQKRKKEGKEINMVEFMYPLMQGYDSVPIKADVELGGTDQLFNLLAGRPIMQSHGLVPQNIMTMNILVGTDGTQKMSKSLGNYVAIFDTPNEMFGKIMSIPDTAMMDYFELLTDIDLLEAKKIITENPRNAKVALAKDVIQFFHSSEAADKAEQDFITKFIKKEVPDEMPDFTVSENEIGILDLLTKITGFTKSNSDARRLVQAGAVSINGEKITDPKMMIHISAESQVLKAGKRKFGRIKKN
jgi:tyrosyl-tRNA synthetase